MNLHKKISHIFSQHKSLEALLETIVANGKPSWLVGGLLRDLFLDRPILDIDLAFDDDPTLLAQSWSRRFSGNWFWLDQKRKQSRVIFSDGVQVDFALLRAETIRQDLKLRDFTINAMAFRLDQGIDKGSLFDPFNGQDDLASNEMALPAPDSFLDDPLRLLKGIRHTVTLGFQCPQPLQDLMRDQAETLKKSAPERIQDELIKILRSKDPILGLDIMINTALLKVLLGDPRTAFDWGQEKSALSSYSDELNSRIHGLELRASTLVQKDDAALMLIAELFARYGVDNPESTLLDGLRFSQRQKNIVLQLLHHRELPPDFVHQLKSITSARQSALLYETLEPFAIHKMINWNLVGSYPSMDQIDHLGRSFNELFVNGRVPDLLSGERVQKLLQTSSGPAIGHWLSKVKHAEITGEIKTITSAEEWLKTENSI